MANNVLTWENMVNGGSGSTANVQRAQVSGIGWLVCVNDSQLIFIPDATGLWSDGYVAATTTSTTTSTQGSTTGSQSSSTTSTTTTGTTTSGSTSTGSTTGNTGSSSTTTTTGSSSSGSTSTSTTTGTNTSSGTLYYLWQNGVQNSWRDQSYTNVSGKSITNVNGFDTGVLGPYGAFNYNALNNVGVSVNNYTAIQFDGYAAAATTLRVQLDEGSSGSPLIYASQALTTTKTTYTIPFSKMTGSYTSTSVFTNLELLNMSGSSTAQVWVNNICLVVNSNPQPTPIVLPTVDPNPVSGSTATVNWLKVSGNKIVDSVTGVAWMGRGVNIEDTNLGGQGVGTAIATTTAEVIRRIDWAYNNLGCDYFRLLLQEFDSAGQVNVNGDIITNTAYLAAIKSIVAHIGTLKGARVGITVDIQYTLDPPVGGAITVNSIPTVTQLVYSFYQCPWVHITLGNEPEYTTTTQYAALVTTYNAVVKAVRTAEAVVGSKNHMLVSCPGVSNYARNVQYFVTNPVQDAYGQVIYTAHIYDSATGDTFQSQYISAASSIPLLCEEFGVVSGYMTLADCAAWQSELEKLQTPYTAWALSQRETPCLLVDTSNGTNGVGSSLQLSQWGLQFINQMRAAKGLGIVDLNGNPVA